MAGGEMENASCSPTFISTTRYPNFLLLLPFLLPSRRHKPQRPVKSVRALHTCSRLARLATAVNHAPGRAMSPLRHSPSAAGKFEESP